MSAPASGDLVVDDEVMATMARMRVIPIDRGAAVSALSFSDDGRLLAACDGNGLIQTYDMERGT